MMTLRQRIMMISGITIGIIAAAVLFILYANRSDEGNTTSPTVSQNQPSTVVDNTSYTPGTITQTQQTYPEKNSNLPPEELYTLQKARIFVERLFTYSNQNDNQHIEDVLDMATPKVQAWMKTTALEEKTIYTGVTTRVFRSVVKEKTDEQTTVTLNVQQETSSENEQGTLNNNMIQREVDVVLIPVGDDWLVDGVWWQD